MDIKFQKAGIAATIFSLCITYKSATLASCWGSNPDGNLTCQEFVSKNGLHLHLCEDQPGDCTRAGYAPAVQSQDEDEAAPTDETETSSPRNPNRQRHSQASDGSSAEPSQEQQDTNLLHGLLAIAGILIVAFVFGGRFIRALIAGTVLGAFGAGETAFWGTMAWIQLDQMTKEQEKLYAEREALFARMNEYAMEGTDSTTGLSGMAAHKRLKADRADWERRARKAGWSTD